MHDDIREKLRVILSNTAENIRAYLSKEELEQIRVTILGKKGELTNVLKLLGTLPAEERPVVGQFANEIRDKIEELIHSKREELQQAEIMRNINSQTLDVTLPAKKIAVGNIHPISKTIRDLEDIFIGMGFIVAEGPDIEYGYYNFTALNIPEDHPARDEQDTFYIKAAGREHDDSEVMLRTATSPTQVRFMELNKPPLRMVCPGRVYRLDEADATHSPMFHQIEGLVVDKGVTMRDLRETLNTFAVEIFGADTKIRFRPHHFPFTEPSAEVDISCFVCGGKGCSVCKGEGWIELLGCGMVHPNVLKGCGIDPDIYSGFAFGMGVDRIVMAKYGIRDLRYLFENNIRFLEQF